MLTIKVILGSTREHRFGDQPAQWITALAKKRGDMDVELLDLKDYHLPFFEEALTPSMIKEPYANPEVARWTQKIAEADGFIVATPEYNHGPSAILKNAFDYVNAQWHNKPIGFVSWGSVGGARAVEQLRLVAVELQMAPIRNGVYMIAPWTMMDAQGKVDMTQFEATAKTTLDQLAWWATALQKARAGK